MSHSAQDAPNISQIVESLTTAIAGLQICRFSNAAAAAIYIWGILTSLDDEVKYFWTSFRWTLPNILYILNRYVCVWFFLLMMYNFSGLHGEFSTKYCRNYVGLIGILLAHLAWSGIMTIRVVALWQSHRLLVVLTWCLWLLAMAAIWTMTITLYFGITAEMTYNRYIRMCSTSNVPRLLVFGPIPQTAYELFLTVLTGIKTCQFVRLSKHKLPPLIHIMARDGVAYFILASCISLANVFCWLFLPPQLTNVVLYLWWAVLSTLSAQLTLNLRKTYYDDPTNSGRSTTQTMSADITFTNAPNNTHSDTLAHDVGVKFGEERSNFRSISTRFVMGDGEFEVNLHPEGPRFGGGLQTDMPNQRFSTVEELEGLESRREGDVEEAAPHVAIPLTELRGRSSKSSR